VRGRRVHDRARLRPLRGNGRRRSDRRHGIAQWIGLGLVLGGAAIGVLLYLLGGARPQTPQMDPFLQGDSPAWYSPPLLAAIRGRSRPARLADEPTPP
jgi:hypothetical protein